jgi:hypothetical protein
MGISFAGGDITELAANKLASSGRVIQTVEVQNAGNYTFGSGAGGDLYSASIVTSAAGNRVLAYLFMYHRVDPGEGPWAIGFNILRYNGPGSGSGSNLIHSGWNGTTNYYLGHYEKFYLHSPGAVGTHTYTANFVNYPQGSTHYVNNAGNQGGEGTGVIRLMEIAA